jgi:predicted Ser/Thr protein kinase
VSLTPGSVVGPYEILSALGAGDMGDVWKARDRRLDRIVAIKTLKGPHTGRFEQEARAIAALNHPNVCTLYDIGPDYLVMEFIDGEPLRGPVGADVGARLACQIASALESAHHRGVLHRDLKPANIMLNQAGQPQLMDFGIATAGDVETSSEGTPTYMAPEHLLGEPVSERSDIYALGMIMYEIFTGRRVFDAQTPLDTLVRYHTSAQTPDRSALDAISNARLRDTILQCLERDPSRRPQSAQAVAGMLQVVVLDATTISRRLVQNVLLALTAVLGMPGLMLVLRTRGDGLGLGLVFLVAGAVAAVAALRHQVGWSITYKGHSIRFNAHPFKGEQLFIDNRLVDRGRIGFAVVMKGTIESGAGAGERITAESKCTFVKVSCRIVAEAFQ